MKIDMVLLKEFKSRIEKQSEIERFYRAKLVLQGKALKLGDEIVKTQGEVIELQQQGITHLDQQKQELQVDVKDLESSRTFLNNRCSDIKLQALNLQEQNELKETFKTLSQAEANSEPKTTYDKHSNEPTLDKEDYKPIISTDEHGKKTFMLKKEF